MSSGSEQEDDDKTSIRKAFKYLVPYSSLVSLARRVYGIERSNEDMTVREISLVCTFIASISNLHWNRIVILINSEGKPMMGEIGYKGIKRADLIVSVLMSEFSSYFLNNSMAFVN